ncbi:MAG TPA: hypothetical protein VGF45_24510, partial [Polyangia bacterium]
MNTIIGAIPPGGSLATAGELLLTIQTAPSGATATSRTAKGAMNDPCSIPAADTVNTVPVEVPTRSESSPASANPGAAPPGTPIWVGTGVVVA